MNKQDRELIEMVNRNADILALERKLNSIAARRKKKGAKKHEP